MSQVPASRVPEPVLSVERLEVVYNRAVRAVDAVSLEVERGEVVAILGPNGAGKTTTMRAISGFAPHEHARITRGTVRFGGVDLTRSSPERRSRLGIGIVPETGKIFDRLTVSEHVRAVAARPDKRDQLFEFFPRLYDRRAELAGNLSGGERQMMAIAATLARDPSLLLIDELSLGLAPKIVDDLLGKLMQIREMLDVAILLVEQNVDKALGIASRCYVLVGGRIVKSADAADLRGRADVWSLLLGEDVGSHER